MCIDSTAVVVTARLMHFREPMQGSEDLTDGVWRYLALMFDNILRRAVGLSMYMQLSAELIP